MAQSQKALQALTEMTLTARDQFQKYLFDYVSKVINAGTLADVDVAHVCLQLAADLAVLSNQPVARVHEILANYIVEAHTRYAELIKVAQKDESILDS